MHCPGNAAAILQSEPTDDGTSHQERPGKHPRAEICVVGLPQEEQSAPAAPRTSEEPSAPPVQVVFAADGPSSCHIVHKAREMRKTGQSEHPSSTRHHRSAGATR
ncbi:hypothetical protein NDU88_006247 [Pleurodeles waltl]|uniref:Uncharacterized protein n=1 Tax=Pleurodeles waltl TaxID=8319 RepID=A0AAV7RNF2_PLEWA|nr:hypothetical protein NDU88_006247 [Pleurodeles waltl]